MFPYPLHLFMGQIQEIKQFMIIEPHAGGWGATDSSDEKVG